MNPETKIYIDRMIRDHIHDGNYSQRITEFNIFKKKRYILYRAVASGTNTAIAAGVGGDFVWPFSGTIIEVGATVDTAGTTNTTTVDINKNGTTILSTKITIDSTEKTSRTALTPSYVSDQDFIVGDIFTFDIDAISTTPAAGLTIFMDVTPS